MYQGWGAAETLKDMMAELEEYYECAGFADFRATTLNGMSARRIRKLYASTFEVDDRPEEDPFLWMNGGKKRNGEVCA